MKDIPLTQKPPSASKTRAGFLSIGGKLFTWLTTGARWESILLVILVALIPILLLVNIDVNPRPWHDEGSYLSLARTIVVRGQYAVWNANGYQTFGPVQSVGPTLILPVALSFKLFGVGLVQGRVVVVLFALLTLLFFYLIARELFDPRTALFALILLISAPAVNFLLYGRQVLGEVPGFGWFLAGTFFTLKGLKLRQMRFHLLAGLCFGAAMVTKSYYLMMVSLALGSLALLDLFYFRTKSFFPLVVTVVVYAACVGLWWGWQISYFGLETFQQDAAKLQQLAKSTIGLNAGTVISTFRYLLGSGTGNFYLFWGVPAFVLMAAYAVNRSVRSLILSFLLLFTIFWIGYMFLMIPWPHYFLAPMGVMALFVSKLAADISRSISRSSILDTFREMGARLRQGSTFPATAALSMGAGVAILSFGLWTGYEFQTRVREFVLDRQGIYEPDVDAPLDLQGPQRITAYIAENIPKDAVIETWERELDILTGNPYHYPDLSMLSFTHSGHYKGGELNYLLGDQYFASNPASYLVIGWFGRSFQIYDPQYITEHARLRATIGEGDWRYDVYELNPQR